MAAIRIDKLEKRFGSVKVLEPLELTIADGEFFTFLGPSGCGKSTVLNLIAGIEAPTAGRIYFDEQCVNDLGPAQRDVAMVFQSYALYPHMSVRENLAFPLRNRRVPRAQIDADVERTARLLGLEGLLERKPRELSGGQRQRVALGRALVRKPRVFLMDEPLSNLDARLRLGMREELKRLHGELGVTTVYVTHDQEEAMALSQRIALLHEGRVQQCGSAKDIYWRPANRFVAGFIGSPPMNFVQGERFLDIPHVRSQFGGRDASALLVGVRPTQLRVQREAAPGALEVRVELVEPAGAESWVVVEWRGERLKAAMASEGIVPGTTAFLRIPADGVHIFDRNSGVAKKPGI